MSKDDTKLDVQAMAAFELFWAPREAEIQFVRTTMPDEEFDELLRNIFILAYAEGAGSTADWYAEKIAELGKRIDQLDKIIT